MRIELKSVLELLQGQVILRLQGVGACQRDVNGGDVVGELSRPAGVRRGFINPFRIWIQGIFRSVSVAKFSKAQRELRIGLHSVVEFGDGRIEIPRLVPALDVAKSLEVRLVGRGINLAAGG